MINLIDTTFTGKDISAGASVYEYTIAASGTFRFQVRLAAVAGNGDYTAWLTLNDGDATADDVIGPKTVYTAGAAETSFWFSSIAIDCLVGDVINVFVDGLAADTNEAGSIRIWGDAAVNAGTSLVEVTAARMGALTDWIDGGRLDLILDIIAADTTTDIPALIAALDVLIDAIKAKTDSLTFTVAAQVDANIQGVNDVAVTGTGASGDEWGP